MVEYEIIEACFLSVVPYFAQKALYPNRLIPSLVGITSLFGHAYLVEPSAISRKRGTI